MNCYGDESGHFNNVVAGHEEASSLAVIGGDYNACRHCAKKTVRRIPTIDELKWSNLEGPNKRRFIECIDDQDLLIGYAAFDRDRLLSIDNSYLLHQSPSHGETPWDLISMGCGYAEIIRNLSGEFQFPVSLEFHQIFNHRQSEKIREIVQSEVPRSTVGYGLSDSNKGIQAADGIAGAAAEDVAAGSNWLDSLDDRRVFDYTDQTLIQPEHRLDESNR